MKLGGFIVGLLVVGLFVSIFSLFYGEVSYTSGIDFDEGNYSIYDQSDALHRNLSKIDVHLFGNETTVPEQGETNFISRFIGSGWSVLKTTTGSFGIFTTLTEATIDKARLGVGTYYFKEYFYMIAFVIFLFLILSVIVGRALI